MIQGTCLWVSARSATLYTRKRRRRGADLASHEAGTVFENEVRAMEEKKGLKAPRSMYVLS